MPSALTIFLKVPKYIKRYLITLYGPQEPIFFPRKSDYNTFILASLERPTIKNRPQFFCRIINDCSFHSEELCSDFNRDNFIEISVPFSKFKNLDSFNYFARRHHRHLRAEIERHFVYDYRTFIREKIREGHERKTATLMFMEQYEIMEDDLTFSAFYRDFNRMLQKRRLSSCKTVI